MKPCLQSPILCLYLSKTWFCPAKCCLNLPSLICGCGKIFLLQLGIPLHAFTHSNVAVSPILQVILTVNIFNCKLLRNILIYQNKAIIWYKLPANGRWTNRGVQRFPFVIEVSRAGLCKLEIISDSHWHTVLLSFVLVRSSGNISRNR